MKTTHNRKSRSFVPEIRSSIVLLSADERSKLIGSIENTSVFTDKAAPRQHYERRVDLLANVPVYIPFPVHQGFEIEHVSGADIQIASENAPTSYVSMLSAGVTRTRDNDVSPGMWFLSTGVAAFNLSTW